MAAAPGPDGHHDDLDQDQLEGLALLVPDDARSLDADRLAYYQELRARARARGDGWARIRRLAASGVTGPLILVLLVVLGLFGSTLGMFGSALPATPPPQPLATPTETPGQVGGLLPDTAVTVDQAHASLREARPALLALVPSSCPTCHDVLRSLAGQAREYGLRLVLIGPPGQQAQLDGLNRDALGGGATVAVDVANVVTPAYDPVGVTALLVASNGVVADVVPQVLATTRLEPQLAQLAPVDDTPAGT